MIGNMLLERQGGRAYPQWPSGRMVYGDAVPTPQAAESNAPRIALFLTTLLGKAVLMAGTWAALSKRKGISPRQAAMAAMAVSLGLSWAAGTYVDKAAGLAGPPRLGDADMAPADGSEDSQQANWASWISTAAGAYAEAQDAHQQVYILRERLVTLESMGIGADSWLYRRTEAKLAAAEREAGLEEETESAARSWNVLAQAGLTTGIGVGLAVIVVLGLVARKLR